MATDTYDALIRQAAQAAGVEFAFLKAIVAAESSFNPRARRGEPQIGDASYGLTQLLGATARRLGYAGTLGDHEKRTGGLYDPAINLQYGARFLRSVLDQVGGELPAAASAYNGGYRPSLGFGRPVEKATTLCLEWKQSAPKTGRTIARDCARSFTAQPGQFGNQPYVDKVMGYYRSFGGGSGGASMTPSASRPVISTADGSATARAWGALVALGGAVVLYVLWSRRR